MNIVELIAEEGKCAFDQPCKFGHRVEDHAVYCHNDNWTDSPRKCRRSWYTGGEVRDEDCPGFQPNSLFTGSLSPTLPAGEQCSKCSGRKLIKTDRGCIEGGVETCPLCMGSGEEPKPVPLTPYEQATLEMGRAHHGHVNGTDHPFVRIASTDTERASIEKLRRLDLVGMRSVTFAGEAVAYLLEDTLKGQSVLRQNWKARQGR